MKASRRPALKALQSCKIMAVAEIERLTESTTTEHIAAIRQNYQHKTHTPRVAPNFISRHVSIYNSSWKHHSTISTKRYSKVESDSEGAVYRAGPMASYQRKVSEGQLRPGDAYQEDALAALQALYDVLIGAAANGQLEKARSDSNRSLWSRWLPRQRPAPVRGLYLWGGVGTGKTMLMDMFFEELPSWFSKKRIHFHDFMLSVHIALQKHRSEQDSLEAVAEDLSKESIILCLDEFMVTDVADAMILNRLFTHLFSKGVILISTSNRPPDKLYENGLQRDLFLPFIELMKNRCVIHKIGSSTDYRRLTAAQQGMFFIGDDASELLKEKVQHLTEGKLPKPATVEVAMGRKLHVPKSWQGVAYFNFEDICELPLGAADFSGLARSYHTVAIDSVPKFGASNRLAAYRFVTLVDVMYEHKTRLVCSAEAHPIELFQRVVTISDAPKRTSFRSMRSEEADITVDNELGFAKDRTISRLTEMQSSEYQDHHQRNFIELMSKEEKQGASNCIGSG